MLNTLKMYNHVKNFRFQPPKKSAADKEGGGFLSHSAWSKIVLSGALIIVVYATNMSAKR